MINGVTVGSLMQ